MLEQPRLQQRHQVDAVKLTKQMAEELLLLEQVVVSEALAAAMEWEANRVRL